MKSALLVIDVQQGLFNPPPAEAEQVLTRINQLSERARQAGAPVIFIQHQTAHEELPHGSEAWQIHAALQVKNGDHRIDKNHAGFLFTDQSRQTADCRRGDTAGDLRLFHGILRRYHHPSGCWPGLSGGAGGRCTYQPRQAPCQRAANPYSP